MSVIVPTYNEAANIVLLLDRLELTLAHLDHEVIVVDDDSPDGTWAAADGVARGNRRVRVLRRIGRRGLSSAVLEGMSLARGRCLAVIDADLQHDETALPAMVEAVLGGRADVAIGSRAVQGGSYGDFGRRRRLMSWAGARLARKVLRVHVSDPMSGFFVVARDHFESVRPTLDGRGFKLLLEILAQDPDATIHETGYRFRLRTAGATKLDAGVMIAFVSSVIAMAAQRRRPAGFAIYATLALLAVGLRASLTELLTDLEPLLPGIAGAIPALVAVTAFEVAVLVEYGMHRRWSFPPSVRAVGGLGALWRFHLVSLHGVAALVGIGTVIDHQLMATQQGGTMASATAATTAATIAGAGAAVLAVTLAAYHLNRAVTWPQEAAPRTPPMTVPTRPRISATARR